MSSWSITPNEENEEPLTVTVSGPSFVKVSVIGILVDYGDLIPSMQSDIEEELPSNNQPTNSDQVLIQYVQEDATGGNTSAIYSGAEVADVVFEETTDYDYICVLYDITDVANPEIKQAKRSKGKLHKPSGTDL